MLLDWLTDWIKAQTTEPRNMKFWERVAFGAEFFKFDFKGDSKHSKLVLLLLWINLEKYFFLNFRECL